MIVVDSPKSNVMLDAMDKTLALDVTFVKMEYRFIRDYIFLPVSEQIPSTLLGRVVGGLCSIPATLVLCGASLIFFLMFPFVYGVQLINGYSPSGAEQEVCDEISEEEKKGLKTAIEPLLKGMSWTGQSTLDFETIFKMEDSDQNYFDGEYLLDETI